MQITVILISKYIQIILCLLIKIVNFLFLAQCVLRTVIIFILVLLYHQYYYYYCCYHYYY